MKNTQHITPALSVAAMTFAAAATFAAEGVSPGSLDHSAIVENRCPTFSWQASPDTVLYELVAYRWPDNEKVPEKAPVTTFRYSVVSGKTTLNAVDGLKTETVSPGKVSWKPDGGPSGGSHPVRPRDAPWG